MEINKKQFQVLTIDEQKLGNDTIQIHSKQHALFG